MNSGSKRSRPKGLGGFRFFLADPAVVGGNILEIFVSCPHSGRGKYFRGFLAVLTVVGENILEVFLAVRTVVGADILDVR